MKTNCKSETCGQSFLLMSLAHLVPSHLEVHIQSAKRSFHISTSPVIILQLKRVIHKSLLRLSTIGYNCHNVTPRTGNCAPLVSMIQIQLTSNEPLKGESQLAAGNNSAP